MTFLIDIFENLGRFFNLLGSAFSRPEKASMYWKEMMRQMNDIGVGSFVIVVIISIFIGAVTAIQFAYQLSGQPIQSWYIGYVVRDMMMIEFAPTLTCLVLAGKVGSNMASEIGGMRQKEQIDAMEIMGLNTASYLIAPKIIAALFVIPLLVIFSMLLGMVGGYIYSLQSVFLTPDEFLFGMTQFFVAKNVVIMMIKAFVFAFLLSSIACYKGYYVKGGSIELGEASTQAVVTSNILILVGDFLIAALFM